LSSLEPDDWLLVFSIFHLTFLKDGATKTILPNGKWKMENQK